jgi:hypothetical protein
MRATKNPGIPASTVRVVGIVAGLIGLAFIALAGLLIIRQIQFRKTVPPDVLLFVLAVSPIAFFFVTAGWRLTLNRPNRYGSFISPTAWRLLAAIFAAVAIWMGIIATRQLELGTAAIPIVGLLMLAAWSWRRAEQLKTVGDKRAVL